ncbi:TPA_asm: hypothetical protein GHN05_15330 [Listeria monocytogenes]|nr:hypothetical protein [Listeria monocytogenes]
MNEDTRKKKKRPSLTTLYEGTMKEITSNENRYIEFLNFASRVHKYIFSVHYKIKKSNGIYPYTVYVILKLSYYYL